LPEAGFLSSLLPTLIGAGLMFATGGAAAPGLFGLSNAATIGLGVGGLQALRTGSLSKGLMAGLGAYGGAGLMGGVMGAGTGAVSGAAGAEGVGAYAANPANALQPIEAIVPPAPVATPYFPEGVGGEFMRPAYGQGALGSGSFNVAQDSAALTDIGARGYSPVTTPMNAPVTNTMVAPSVTPAQAFPAATGVAPQYGLSQEAINIGDIYGQEQAAQNAVAQKLATTTPAQVAKAGFGEVFKDPSKFLTKDNLKYGLAALSPALFQEKKSAQAPVDKEQFRYAYDPGRLETPTQVGGIGEYTYFRPSYTRLAAEGGTMTSDYTYDPETQLYSREKTPPQQDRASSGNAGPYTMGAPDAAANGFQNLTPAEQAAFFAENPNMAAITQAAQKGFGLTSLGMLQGLVNPNFVSRQESIAQGVNPDIADPSMESAGLNPGDTGISAATEAAGSGPSTAGSDSPGEKRGGIIRRAVGGISHLGDYSDGGRLLRGPGDGVSDSIPATIANKRPARLADGEFVVPARIVSELGNGSTEAGARKLYAMMDRIQKNRTKSVGKGKVAVNSRSEKLLPA
jgi:hypothetical protein